MERLSHSQCTRPSFWSALGSEDSASYATDSGDVLKAQRSYGAMPLTTERLRELESLGIVKREVVSGPPVKVSYELTCSGYELEPIITVIEARAEKWIVLETPANE